MTISHDLINSNRSPTFVDNAVEFISDHPVETVLLATIGAALLNAVINKMRSIDPVSKILNSQEIYRPKVPNEAVLTDLSGAKVPGLTPYCTCVVFNKLSHTWEQALISYSQRDGIHNLVATSSTGQALGYISIMHYSTMPSGVFGCPALVFQDDASAKYGTESEMVDKIEIKDLKNNLKDQYAHVGYNLVKAAMQRFPQVNCRVDLSSAWDSQAFYWKLGFRSASEPMNRRIAAWVHAGPTGRDNGNHKMYLPAWASQAWSQEIRNNPLPTADIPN